MFGFIKKNSKKIFAVAFLASVVLLMTTAPVFAAEEAEEAAADSGGWGAAFAAALGAVVIPIAYKILYLIGYVAAIVFKFGGYLIDAILYLNTQIINSSIVTTGWAITRDFANLGFVLAIIYVAFATMLRVSSFGLKQFLVRLVAMALLINFSLAIAGVFINASDKVSAFFIGKIRGEGGISQFAQVLRGPTPVIEAPSDEEESGLVSTIKFFGRTGLAVSTFGLSEVFSAALDTYKIVSGKNADGKLDLAESALIMVGKVFFLTAFTVMSGIVFFAIGLMMLVRWAWLIMLLILAPFAWLSYAVPRLDRYFEMWWEKFWKWTLYLPIVLFFLYLAMTSVISPTIPNAPTAPLFSTAQLPGYKDTPSGNDFGSYGQIVVAIALMVAGLIVGEKMGFAGAKTGLAAANSVQSWAVGKVKAFPAAAGGASVGRLLRSETKEKGVTQGQRIARGLAAIPLIGTAAARGLDAISTRRPQEVETSQKQFTGMSDALLLSTAGQSLWRFSDPEAAAVVKELAKRKKLAKLPPDQLLELAKKGKAFDAEKEVYKVRPDLSDNPLEIFRGLSPSQKAELAPDVYYEAKKSNDPKKRAIVLSLKEKDLREIANKASDEVIDAITATLKETVTAHSAGGGAGYAPGSFTPAEEASLKTIMDALLNPGLKSTFNF